MSVEDYPAYFESPGGTPIITAIGEVFDEQTIGFMRLAADELNFGLEQPRYSVTVGSDSSFAANGMRLPEGSYRVRIEGNWVEDKSLAELWERVDELKADFTK